MTIHFFYLLAMGISLWRHLHSRRKIFLISDVSQDQNWVAMGTRNGIWRWRWVCDASHASDGLEKRAPGLKMKAI